MSWILRTNSSLADMVFSKQKERATAGHRQWSRGELKQKLRALAHGAGVVRESHWVALFSRYDKDNSGELEIDEFKVRAKRPSSPTYPYALTEK